MSETLRIAVFRHKEMYFHRIIRRGPRGGVYSSKSVYRLPECFDHKGYFRKRNVCLIFPPLSSKDADYIEGSVKRKVTHSQSYFTTLTTTPPPRKSDAIYGQPLRQGKIKSMISLDLQIFYLQCMLPPHLEKEGPL